MPEKSNNQPNSLLPWTCCRVNLHVPAIRLEHKNYPNKQNDHKVVGCMSGTICIDEQDLLVMCYTIVKGPYLWCGCTNSELNNVSRDQTLDFLFASQDSGKKSTGAASSKASDAEITDDTMQTWIADLRKYDVIMYSIIVGQRWYMLYFFQPCNFYCNLALL